MRRRIKTADGADLEAGPLLLTPHDPAPRDARGQPQASPVNADLHRAATSIELDRDAQRARAKARRRAGSLVALSSGAAAAAGAEGRSRGSITRSLLRTAVESAPRPVPAADLAAWLASVNRARPFPWHHQQGTLRVELVCQSCEEGARVLFDITTHCRNRIRGPRPEVALRWHPESLLWHLTVVVGERGHAVTATDVRVADEITSCIDAASAELPQPGDEELAAALAAAAGGACATPMAAAAAARSMTPTPRVARLLDDSDGSPPAGLFVVEPPPAGASLPPDSPPALSLPSSPGARHSPSPPPTPPEPSSSRPVSMPAGAHHRRAQSAAVKPGPNKLESHMQTWMRHLCQHQQEATHATLSGWLHKRTSFGTWQRRWFELRDNRLFYYRSDSSVAPRGCIPMHGVRCFLVPGDSICISGTRGPFDVVKFRPALVSQLRTTYVLRAPNAEAARQWQAWLSSSVTNDVVTVAAGDAGTQSSEPLSRQTDPLLRRIKPRVLRAVRREVMRASPARMARVIRRFQGGLFGHIPLPRAQLVEPAQTVRDVIREKIRLNGTLFSDMENSTALVSALEALVGDFCPDLAMQAQVVGCVLTAASRTITGGDSYFVLQRLLGRPEFTVTPASAESRPIRIDVSGDGAVVVISASEFELFRLDHDDQTPFLRVRATHTQEFQFLACTDQRYLRLEAVSTEEVTPEEAMYASKGRELLTVL